MKEKNFEKIEQINKNNKTKNQKSKFLTTIKLKLILLRELLLGQTKKQTTNDKQSYIGKKMIFLFAFFSFYTFLIFIKMNTEIKTGSFLDIFMYYIFFTLNPYLIGIALTFTYIFLSFLFCNELFLKWFFNKKLYLKHPIIMGVIFTGSIFLSLFIDSKNIDIYVYLALLSMLWLIFQSIRIFSAARKGATKLEIKFSNQYSPFLYFIAKVIPFVILGILVFISWSLRYGIVIFTLDYIAVHVPGDAFIIYQKEMNEIIPMLYMGLLMVFIFMIFQIILSKKKRSSKRAGTFDNLTFSLISFFMFFYAIYNIILYLFLDSDFISAVNIVLGNETQSKVFFIVEFFVTILFFIWISIDLYKQFKTGLLFFTNDGQEMLLIATIIAQTTARFRILHRELGVISNFSKFLQYDYLVLPFIILGFLGFSIIIYWLKPHEMSMFMHINDAAADSEIKAMDLILSFLKREYIRRGESFNLSSTMIKSLMKITGLSKGIIFSLIYRLEEKYLDVRIYSKRDPKTHEKLVYFDFIPITQQYSNNAEAAYRAKIYLQDQFSQTISKKRLKRLTLTNDKKSSSKQSDFFIQALSVQYGKKVKDDTSRKKYLKEKQVIIDRAIDEDSKKIVYEIIKLEYIRRIKQISDYPEDFRFKISEIASSVEEATRINLGDLYFLLKEISHENWNFSLSKFGLHHVEVDEDDRWVEFLPITEFDVWDALAEYRPESTKEIVVLMQTWFYRNIIYKRKKLKRLPPIKYPDKSKNLRRSYRSRWFARTMKYFDKNFNDILKIREKQYHSNRFQKLISQIITGITNQNNTREKRRN